MTDKLSERFYGNKIFKQEHYDAIRDGPPHASVLKDAFCKLFDKYGRVNANLEELLVDFLTVNAEFAQSQQYPFQKFTTFMELAAWVFQSSFDGHKTRQESFEEFR